MTPKTQIISEYEKARDEFADQYHKNNYVPDIALPYVIKDCKSSYDAGATSSPIVKLMESALKDSCSCNIGWSASDYDYTNCYACDAIQALDSLRKWVGEK